jgi:hypothetical protein
VNTIMNLGSIEVGNFLTSLMPIKFPRPFTKELMVNYENNYVLLYNSHKTCAADTTSHSK